MDLRKGITLPETLVTMGIIGLLASITIPAISKTRHTARNIRCQTNLQQYGYSMNSFAASEGKNRDLQSLCAYRWSNYLDTRSMQSLPDYMGPLTPDTNLGEPYLRPELLNCPAAPRKGQLGYSNILNSIPINHESKSFVMTYWAGLIPTSPDYSYFENGAMRIMAGFGANPICNNFPSESVLASDMGDITIPWPRSQRDSIVLQNGNRLFLEPTNPHQKNADDSSHNRLYLDGHVNHVTEKQLIYPNHGY